MTETAAQSVLGQVAAAQLAAAQLGAAQSLTGDAGADAGDDIGAGAGTDEITAAEVAQWLSGVVAEMTDRSVDEIRPDLPLSEYGMESVYVLGLCAEIEDRYQVELDSALVWDHPAIGPLSEVLVPMIAARRAR
jgi:acyl carrier protein